MSALSSPSPVLAPTAEVDEAKLPQGNCRYIMMNTEVKGSRCACVNFTLNQALPGASCECGHLACFHHKTAEPPADRREMELLRQRVQQLEELLAEGDSRSSEVVQRVSQLEGVVDSRTEEIGQEIKKTYGNLNRAWHSIGELERRSGDVDNRFQAMGVHFRNVDGELQRLHQRQCELNDADLSLEEQLLEVVESIEVASEITPPRGRRRRKSVSDSTPAPSNSPRTTLVPVRSGGVPARSPGSTLSNLWTVHVSLLPSSSLPFPFERDTNAYKRCLSRGLHQMVAVNGTSAEAFVSAVTRAFKENLKDRPWVPLQAKLCDADTLQGLPMLRPLDSSLASSKFDVDFLRAHCAVLDVHGNMDSLYIAMRHSSLSWHALKHSPVFLQGLEASWEYDPILDSNDPFDNDESVDENDRPSAGDLVGSLPNFKRAASEMSRSSTTTTIVDGAEGRPAKKVPRTACPPSFQGVRRRRVETV
ncbi:hypothetical protein N8I77_009170 [Diaporthe amygdali]|uniref:Uncharacterized protein n=1 Tax=Phomopsis amygdali TaxID=1214568 RepID=A0AAD9SAF7_PHOAM|nr:hypothetical protein N8I77_009170 [Diaporthe amygdali]